tara:strand:- start:164 stop:580 length:417 start_codon:yes stop_codon:yes gene_type:complete
MKKITEIQQDIIEEFNLFEDWMQKYEYLIDLGKELPDMDIRHKKDENLITGCQSKVWLHAEKIDHKIIYSADSDAIMTKGIIALLIRVLSNQKPIDIEKSDLMFIDNIGLKEHLSITRANGLLSMVKEMKIYALSYIK